MKNFSNQSRRLVALFSVVVTLLFCVSAASAAAPGRVTKQKIDRGVIDLGLDSLLLVNREAGPAPGGEATALDVSWTIGTNIRYFLMKNLALGINANFFLVNKSSTFTPDNGAEVETSASDSGGLGFVIADYYLPVGFNFFIKPGIGAGGFYGTRSVPDAVDSSRKIESTLSGFAAKGDIALVFYAGNSMNLRAGVSVIYEIGSNTLTPAGGGEEISNDFSLLNAGFNIGVGYSF